MSLFSYNGIVITPTRTVEVVEEPIRTDDNVDFLWMHYVITVEGLYSPGQTAYGTSGSGQPIAVPGNYGPDTDQAIRFYLEQPRQQLIYSFTLPGNVTSNVMISPANIGNGNRYITDANNGPNPINCLIRRVDGNKVFHITFTVETWVRECSANESILISNRFSQTTDYDERHRVVSKTSQGRAVFRQDLLLSTSQLADDFRSFIFPPISPGLRREKIRVVASSTQNMLDWTCIDTEPMHELGETSPLLGGSGVINIHGEYSVSSMATEGGAQNPMAIAECKITVEGNKYATNFNLIQAAFVVASARLPIGNRDPKKAMLVHTSINSVLTDRKIGVSIVYKLFPPAQGLPGAQQLPFDQLAQPAPFAFANGIYPSFPNDSGTRGTELETLISSALRDACKSYPPTPDCNPGAKGYGEIATYCGPGPAIEVSVQQYLPTNPTKYNQNAPIYQENSSYSRYSDDSGNRQLVPTGPPPGTSSSNTSQNSEVIQVRSRATTRDVYWTAESYGQPPQVPPRTTNNNNETFLDGEITLNSVVLMPDGQNLAYRVSGIYTYANTSPNGVGDTIPFDVPPWLTYIFGQDDPNAPMNLYGGKSSGSNYVHGIIDPPSGGSQAQGPAQ